jgi:hypothetical protein
MKRVIAGCLATFLVVMAQGQVLAQYRSAYPQYPVSPPGGTLTDPGSTARPETQPPPRCPTERTQRDDCRAY